MKSLVSNDTPKISEKLAKTQRKLAKKVKFSANWHKQKAKITRLQTHIAAARHDFLHKTSTQLSKNHAMIVIEDLKIANMTRSSKGTTEAPGKKGTKNRIKPFHFRSRLGRV